VRQPVTDFTRLPRLPPGCALIDSHCHLDIDEFDGDRVAVIERALHAGVPAMVTIGASAGLESNRQAVALAAHHVGLHATVGIHPHDAGMATDAVVDEVARLAHDPKVVAIGETGLDYYYDNSPRVAQQAAFRRFIALARARALPLVIHLRDADADALAILREEQAGAVGGVIHCFSSDARAATALLDLGFHLSFSGIVTFKTAEAIRAAARITPTDRLLIETDAPFLAPVPFRGRRNEPALVIQTAAVLSEIRGESLETLAAYTRENTERLFRLPSPR